MNKAIGYIRVSTEQQAEEGVSLAAQKAKIAAWCLANDYELVEVFVDAGISGKSRKNRKGLEQALSEIKKDMAMVVYSFSRLARSSIDLLTISNELTSKKADLVSLAEKIDTTSASGKLFFTIMAGMAQFERDVIAERTKSAMSHKKSVGDVYSPTPFGFQAIDGKLQQVESEALVVSEILAMRSSGTTLSAIADSLNNRGIEGKRGGKWFSSTVRYLIQRQVT
jgi:site-specific DNA recombinase